MILNCVAHAVDSAITLNTPSFSAVGRACSAIWWPTTADHWPSTIPSATRTDQPRFFASSRAALPSGCGSRMSGPGPDQLRRRPATRPDATEATRPRPASCPRARAAARASSRVRLTKSNPGDFIDRSPRFWSGRSTEPVMAEPPTSIRCHRHAHRCAPAWRPSRREYPRAPRQSPTPVRRTRPPSPTLDGA